MPVLLDKIVTEPPKNSFYSSTHVCAANLNFFLELHLFDSYVSVFEIRKKYYSMYVYHSTLV